MNAREMLLAEFHRLAEVPDAVPRLRRFVLDLAVRGKLVEQHPMDEPASGLLEEAAAMRRTAADDIQVRNLQGMKPVRNDDLPTALPAGWASARLGALAMKLGAGSTPRGGRTAYQDQGIPFIRSQNVYDDGLRLNEVARIPRATHEQMSGTHVQAGDLLLNITGASIGRCALVPSGFHEGNVSQHVAIIRLLVPSVRDFLHVTLRSPLYQQRIHSVQVGVSREGLSMSRLLQFPIPLPPLAEQRRIVAKVDELMALCDRLETVQREREEGRDRLLSASLFRLHDDAEIHGAGRTGAMFVLRMLPRLSTRPGHVALLRRSILDLGVRGRLVAQLASEEPASALLDRVARRKHEAGSSKVGRDWLRGTSAPVEELFSVPAGWTWTRIAGAVERVTVGFVGSMTQHYVAGGVPFLRSQNVRANRFRPDGLITVSRTFHESIMKSALAPGDVVVVRSGNVGTACVVPSSIPEANCADLVVVQRPTAVLPEYLCFYLNSMAEQHIEDGTVGMALTHFNTEAVATMPLPLPPLAEQSRIVAKVDELMGVCDRLETELSTSRTEGTRFLEGVLHEALAEAS